MVKVPGIWCVFDDHKSHNTPLIWAHRAPTIIITKYSTRVKLKSDNTRRGTWQQSVILQGGLLTTILHLY